MNYDMPVLWVSFDIRMWDKTGGAYGPLTTCRIHTLAYKLGGSVSAQVRD